MSRTIRNQADYRCFRRPKTTAELRDSEACRVDGVKKRKARCKRRIPTAWEDMPVAARKEISRSVSEKS